MSKPYVTSNPMKKRGWASRSIGPHHMRPDVSDRVVSRAYQGMFKRIEKRLKMKGKSYGSL